MANKGVLDAWLYGKECVCSEPKPARPLHFVLLGAPGVGKGTQAEYLSEKYKAVQLSTGDVFRAAKSTAEDALSAAMQAAMAAMKAGKLVSDDTVISMVRERGACLASDYGFLLDGFPRTVEQAKALEDILGGLGIKLDAVLNYALPTEEVVKRLSGRRTCKQCKATAHIIFSPPKVEGVCDKCGGELFQREDDQPESIRVRLGAYEESTAPLAAYYEAQGLLITITADGAPKEVFAATEALLKEKFQV